VPSLVETLTRLEDKDMEKLERRLDKLESDMGGIRSDIGDLKSDVAVTVSQTAETKKTVDRIEVMLGDLAKRH
jgi:peptidoglycan hydrolase CwlO-like protein